MPGRILEIRLFRFVLVGASSAGLFFVLSYVLVLAGLTPFFASTLAYAIAFVVAYTAQRGWTFGGRHAHSHSFPRYLALQAACALFSGLVAHAAVALFGLSPLAMSAVTALLAGAASYVASSRWVFPDRG